MKLFSDIPDRMNDIIQLFEKSPANENSTLLKYLSTQLYLKTAKFLCEMYRFRDQLMFSSSVNSPLSTYNNVTNVDIMKMPPVPVTTSRDSNSMVTLTRSDIVAWIMRCWTSGLESFHILEQIRIISIMVIIFARIGLNRKRIFFLRQLYNLLGSLPHASNSSEGIHLSTEENVRADSVIELMKKVASMMSSFSIFGFRILMS